MFVFLQITQFGRKITKKFLFVQIKNKKSDIFAAFPVKYQ